MAFCDSCGHKLRSKAKFCASCGTSREPTDEEEAMMKLKDNMDTLVEALGGEDGDSILPSRVFPLDKSKLH